MSVVGIGKLAPTLPSAEGLELAMQDVRNLMITRKGDRPMRAGLGVGLYALLFEQADDASTALVESEIREQLRIYENRFQVLHIEVVLEELDSDLPKAHIKVTVRPQADPSRVDILRIPVEGIGGAR